MVYHALIDKTTGGVVKCFNRTGFENTLKPKYIGEGIDLFMAGDTEKAKSVPKQLALDDRFGCCIDFGKADKVELFEKFALSMMNLYIMQGQVRNMAYKVVWMYLPILKCIPLIAINSENDKIYVGFLPLTTKYLYL
jgi:predicted dinucleotide-binding enzyme